MIKRYQVHRRALITLTPSEKNWPGSLQPLLVGGGWSPPPWRSDVHLLRDGERVVHLDAKVADGALQLGMAKQQLTARRFPVRR